MGTVYSLPASQTPPLVPTLIQINPAHATILFLEAPFEYYTFMYA